MAERFANERLSLDCDLKQSVGGAPAKTAETAEDHSKGPINATVGKSGCCTLMMCPLPTMAWPLPRFSLLIINYTKKIVES